MTPKFWILELRETREKKIHRPELTTFYYNGMGAGFTIAPEKAMRFESHQEGYEFVQRHGLFSFDVVQTAIKEKVI